MLCRGKGCGENCTWRENCGGILRRGKIMEKICTDTKLCKYCGGRESCKDTVNKEKIVETSCRERTFSELIIVSFVSIGDVVMPNIVRVILSRTVKWRCMWQF